MVVGSFIFLNLLIFGFDLLLQLFMEKRVLFLGLFEFVDFDDGFGKQHDGHCDHSDQ